jgi:hypothetical protein
LFFSYSKSSNSQQGIVDAWFENRREIQVISEDDFNTNQFTTNNMSSTSPVSAEVGEKRRARRSIRADDKKKLKPIPRCTSPSHFVVDTQAVNPLSQHDESLRADAFLSAVANLYFRPRLPLIDGLYNRPTDKPLANGSANSNVVENSTSAHSENSHPQTSTSSNGVSSITAAEVWVSSEYDRTEYSTIDLLLSPLRKESVLDKWTAKEIALFEAGICTFGKEFHSIARLMPNKTTAECVDFYYLWKKSGHYALWKEYGKPVRRLAHGKEEQWKAQQDKMKAFQSASSSNTSNKPNTIMNNEEGKL